ncbi:MAG TPA: 50S ribosomal protein L9 [Candidatus Paceibacterota bacterium]|nr:50S ribosomal protein L9 [Verrucomicrobiota bacterium]HOX02312.1 50S ribosomal protein L9 [Verrucomicrobiota bacterium]HRZ45104.1 50S ribosomal protein L9 [Candidatus Paceibacterota bacterium]HRZ92164.1 50S ribosomal protein L9 [Candidatus Paceibacterota bacterium]
MPKIDVILTKNITGLGAESDHVKVAAGYARNYLYPHQLAIPVSAANKRRLEVLRQRRGEREAHELNSMQELARALSKLTLKVLVKTGEDGKMYGSVTGGTISDELKTQYEIALDKRKIHLEKPIRTLGDHEVEMRLHADVTATLKVVVESSNPPPAPEPAPAPQEGDDRRKGEGRREHGRSDRPRGSSRRPAPPAEA